MNITGFKKYMSKYNIEVLRYEKTDSNYSGHLQFDLSFSRLIRCNKNRPSQFFNKVYCWHNTESNVITCAVNDFEDFIKNYFRDLPQELIDINRKLDTLNKARVECIETMKEYNIKENEDERI